MRLMKSLSWPAVGLKWPLVVISSSIAIVLLLVLAISMSTTNSTTSSSTSVNSTTSTFPMSTTYSTTASSTSTTVNSTASSFCISLRGSFPIEVKIVLRQQQWPRRTDQLQLCGSSVQVYFLSFYFLPSNQVYFLFLVDDTS